MVKLVDNYYLLADSHCYMLKEKVTVQDKNSKNYGEEDFRILGYYSSFKDCLGGILKSELRKYISNSDTNSIQELYDEIQRLHKKIDSIKIKE